MAGRDFGTAARSGPVNEGPPPGRVRITSPEGWVVAAVEALEGAISAGLQSTEGPVHIGLSGGDTPKPVYQALAERGRVDWSRIVVLPADERFVPEGDPESNHATIRKSILPEDREGPRIPFFGQREGRSLQGTARALAEALPDRLHLLVLGIGEDGHTASLFPGDVRLLQFGLRDSEDTNLGKTRFGEPGTTGPGSGAPITTLVVRDSPKPPAERVTITPPVIASARTVVMLARGTGKAAAVRRALRGVWDPVGTPAQWARPGRWVLDPGAASAL